jgi:hypothetical protein
MPQPFFPEDARHMVVDSIGAIEQRPQCAILIASCLNEWSRVERDLFEIAAAIAGDSTPVFLLDSQSNSWQTEPDPTVLQTFPLTDGITHKLRAVENVLKKKKWPPHLDLMWVEISNEVRALAKERNDIAHALWCYVDDHPLDVLRKDLRTDTFLRYAPSHFKKLLRRLERLWGLLLEFHVQGTGANAGLNLPPPFRYQCSDPSDGSA